MCNLFYYIIGLINNHCIQCFNIVICLGLFTITFHSNINECSKRGVCGAAECINTDGAYYCSCAHRAGINPVTLQCENDQTSGTGGKGSPTNATTGSESSCKDEDCLFSCQQFASSYYCGCPLGYQLVDKGHCIATISPPDEKYFDNRLPLPHVPDVRVTICH
ncbi:hypothetical protein EB796_015415 [Bugula neritina]|uniref:EGF-like domain-containing protein n=1 Tax=Bugula neritina TaxID=10212 RepID=A0A7J7JKV7_BUGNE|nr:hypothetical protein EB796_015415 [Bugula neritina]